MANKVNIKVNLAKIRGAFKYTIQGKSSSKECICIPVEALYAGKDGAYYINFIGYDANGKYNKLYSIKEQLSYDQFKSMSQEERNAMPFLGDIAEIKPKVELNAPMGSAYGNTSEDGDLPF